MAKSNFNTLKLNAVQLIAVAQIHRAKKNLASAKIVKVEFNANLYLLGFPILQHLRNAGKCLEVKENDTEELSNSVFVNVITSFFSDFPIIILRGVARFFHFRVEIR